MVFQGALYHVSPEWIPKLILRKSPIVVLYRGGHLQDCKAYSSGKGGENWQNSYEKKKKTIMKAFISRELGGLMIISNELIFHAFLQLFMKKEA